MKGYLPRLLILGLAGAFVLPPQPCLACACPTGPDPSRVRDFLAGPTAVFRGRVSAIAYRPGADRFSGGPNLRATFLVETSWKGPATHELVVVSGGMCGHHFEPGQEWLVFAYTYPADPYKGELSTHACSGNVALLAASPAVVNEYLAILGPGTRVGEPLPSGMPNVGGGGGTRRPPPVASAVAGILLAGLGLRRLRPA